MKLMLIGYVNKQNCRIQGTENPHAYIKKPTHPKRIIIWCGFWSTSAYFVNGKTQLMSDLTDNQFYPSAERIWFVFASLSGPAIDLQKMPILAKKKIILSDEAHFDIGGYVNKQNCRIWDTFLCPHAYIENPTQPKRVTIWCGFWSKGIIDPFFFENEQGEVVTVNGDHYRAMYNKFLYTRIEEDDIGNIWFQQEGTTCHTAKAALDVLRPVVENRIISRRDDVVWPPRS